MGCGASKEGEVVGKAPAKPAAPGLSVKELSKAEIKHGLHHGASDSTSQHYDQPIAKYYEFGKELGHGSFAVVYEAYRRTDRLHVAVKAIDTHAVNYRPKEVDAEVSLLQSVDHPNIIKLFEVFESPNHFYMVIEFVDGGELFDQIIERGHYSEADAANIMRQVFLAVQTLHSKDIVHRDLKPENLLYHNESDGRLTVKIADFGLATVCHQGHLLKQPCGTPGYVAPEVLNRAANSKGYDSAVDLWSCGVIMYILLSGMPPFYDEDMKDLFRSICAGKYDFPSPEWDGVSASAKMLVKCLLVVDPVKRYSTHQALSHPWFQEELPKEHLTATQHKLSSWSAHRKLKGAVSAVMGLVHVRHLSTSASHLTGAVEAASKQKSKPTPHDLIVANGTLTTDASASRITPEPSPRASKVSGKGGGAPSPTAASSAAPTASTPTATTPTKGHHHKRPSQS